jgi:hypothetical protein
MSDRERWIVYPLLLLALGTSLRDKLTRTVEADHILCRDILVIDSNDRPTLLVGGRYVGQGRSAPGPVISIIDSADRTTAYLGDTIQCRNLVASGLMRAGGITSPGRIESQSVAARAVMQTPSVLITNPQGKPAAILDPVGFRKLQITLPKVSAPKPVPEKAPTE